jgi:citrate lyase beta subunit
MTDNRSMRILQVAAMQEPEVMARLIRASRRGQAMVVLDLEDGLWDVIDETQTGAVRTTGRENLVTLASTHPELFAGQPIGVRINRTSGPDAAPDLEALSQASRFVAFECIVPTKVETGAEIQELSEDLRHRGVAFRSVVPIVETRRGLANVDEILATARHAGVERLVYGHFDFALDSGWWPFPEPHEPRYWDHVEPLIRRWEEAGLGYVHPPYFQTHDRAGMAGIIGRLQRTCTREFGIITIGPRQTENGRPTGQSGHRHGRGPRGRACGGPRYAAQRVPRGPRPPRHEGLSGDASPSGWIRPGCTKWRVHLTASVRRGP